jgi:hypothetical protein
VSKISLKTEDPPDQLSEYELSCSATTASAWRKQDYNALRDPLNMETVASLDSQLTNH